MYDPDDGSDTRRPRGEEYQDYHFHDDDEIVPTDDVAPRKLRASAPRKPNRRPAPRRHYYED
jgi:hypothetical protein